MAGACRVIFSEEIWNLFALALATITVIGMGGVIVQTTILALDFHDPGEMTS